MPLHPLTQPVNNVEIIHIFRLRATLCGQRESADVSRRSRVDAEFCNEGGGVLVARIERGQVYVEEKYRYQGNSGIGGAVSEAMNHLKSDAGAKAELKLGPE
ncbi:uncharacterized protein [Physcomitrium patens]|uniref:uncharacterized protein n=1 Tax=Physcomitrium patens TaxID=3218 RepID=UPI003CCE00AE